MVIQITSSIFGAMRRREDIGFFPPLLTSPPTGGRGIGGLTPPNPPKAARDVVLGSM
jgi:hypothetical protein